MHITADTRVSDLLEGHPDLVEVLAEFNPHFAKLRNRVLRRIMAPRVTVGQAARIAQVDVGAMLTVLARATGQAPAPSCCAPAAAPGVPPAPAERPPFLDQFAGDRLVTVDVREDISRGQEPFAKIMAAVKGLGPGQAILLRNVFEPVPLYQVLAKRGLEHWTECRGPEDWWIWFYPPPEARDVAPASPRGEVAEAPGGTGGMVVVDARGLEPPQPMQRILEALAGLPAGASLLAKTDRRPMLLYPKLDERGYQYDTREADGDGFETRIWR